MVFAEAAEGDVDEDMLVPQFWKQSGSLSGLWACHRPPLATKLTVTMPVHGFAAHRKCRNAFPGATRSKVVRDGKPLP
jgi:hypothetical protein